jgi:hypothetical protein
MAHLTQRNPIPHFGAKDDGTKFVHITAEFFLTRDCSRSLVPTLLGVTEDLVPTYTTLAPS